MYTLGKGALVTILRIIWEHVTGTRANQRQETWKAWKYLEQALICVALTEREDDDNVDAKYASLTKRLRTLVDKDSFNRITRWCNLPETREHAAAVLLSKLAIPTGASADGELINVAFPALTDWLAVHSLHHGTRSRLHNLAVQAICQTTGLAETTEAGGKLIFQNIGELLNGTTAVDDILGRVVFEDHDNDNVGS